MASRPITEEEIAEYIKNTSGETDFVNTPPHYINGKIECIDYIEDALSEEEFRGYLRGCMIKYQHRLMLKGSPKLNAEKISWYGNRLVQAL